MKNSSPRRLLEYLRNVKDLLTWYTATTPSVLAIDKLREAIELNIVELETVEAGLASGRESSFFTENAAPKA